jgi:hypothetical protein
MLRLGIIGEQQIKGLWMIGDEQPKLSGAIMLVVQKGTKC